MLPLFFFYKKKQLLKINLYNQKKVWLKMIIDSLKIIYLERIKIGTTNYVASFKEIPYWSYPNFILWKGIRAMDKRNSNYVNT